ncbi:Na+/melibiose symporter-like transporter [Diaminobutyricimonas aerilata]|uniref:Na+/melibiose symporter-like transporter n=2 Tax=Diaminobutyricimonas aerilata TaxID=1162967 RepID=A0A2M9CMU5_9MICO|nr:Na+/melibiose symporter-like transporter [Diaminobutyricimonas aerilata]
MPRLAMVMTSLYVAIGGVVAVLLPAQIERIDPQGKVAALSAATSIAFAVTLFSQPLLGAASDRARRRLGSRAGWMLASALVGSVAVALMGWTGTIVAVCVVWAAAQFALNGVDITASAAVVDEFPRGRRGRPSGALAASVAVGTAIGAVIAGSLASRVELGFALVAAIALVGAVAFVGVRRPARSAPRRGTLRRPVESVDSDSRGGREAGGRGVRRSPGGDFAWALGARFAFTFGQQAVSTYLLYILDDHVRVPEGEAPLYVGALTATGLVGLIVTAAISGWWSDRSGRRRVLLVVSSVIFAAALLLPIVAPVLPVMFAYAFLQGVALGMHLAVAGALISEVLPGGDRRPGRDLGLANTAINGAQALAPLAAGGIVVVSGGYQALFASAILAALLSAALAWRVRSIG